MMEEEYLALSGIQHFAFCQRQWALIHIEQVWEENARTVEGQILHKRAHDDGLKELRGDVLTIHGLRISSRQLKMNGICDVVEFHRDPNGVKLFGREGQWLPFPVEYKRGRVKENECDELQLCAQAICLEEMFVCTIKEGSLYYGEMRRRHRVAFTEEMREHVIKTAEEMHRLYDRQHTPQVRITAACKSCSLKEICLPLLQRNDPVSEYIRTHTGDDA